MRTKDDTYEFLLEMHRSEVEDLVLALNRVDTGDFITIADYKVLAQLRNALAPLIT